MVPSGIGAECDQARGGRRRLTCRPQQAPPVSSAGQKDVGSSRDVDEIVEAEGIETCAARPETYQKQALTLPLLGVCVECNQPGPALHRGHLTRREALVT